MQILNQKWKYFVLITTCLYGFIDADLIDPLPSWNNFEAKAKILDFVEQITLEENELFVPVENRIAAFDLDGTLLIEKPFSAQAQFLIDRAKDLAFHPLKAAPSIVKAILSLDLKTISKLHEDEVANLMTNLYKGLTCDAYREDALDWFKSVKHSKKNQLFSQLTYQPMLEVIQLLKNNHFKIYIVSGSGQEFVRMIADHLKLTDVDRIIGTTARTKYSNKNGKVDLVLTGEIVRKNNHEGKVEGINVHIGKKPIIAFGNSDGDKEMLEWACSGSGLHLVGLIKHDDANREYFYDKYTISGKLSEDTVEYALERDWSLISMKKDWNKIFSNE